MSLLRIVEDPFAFLAERRLSFDSAVAEVVAATIADVKARGDAALLDSARRFDAPLLETLTVSDREIDTASVPPEHADPIRLSIERVRAFHEAQVDALMPGRSSEHGWTWSTDDGSLGQRILPVASAGIYVPGGKANYPSSVIMNAVPAQVAGVPTIAITTPALDDGTLSPAVLFAARELGITRLVKIGGAAAIAALALGTESVPRVDKIAGPGNKFVNEAKRQLWGQVGLDGYAGPSEVCVLADETTNAAWAAADLLTQVEHSEDNAGFLVCTSRAKLEEILDAAEAQIATAPRAATLRAALANEGAAFVARDLDEACDIVNAIAPEHLSIAIENPGAVLHKIQNAGCVLLGEYTPESAGDFVAGPSHTLPTSGAARFGSPVNVLDFLKLQSVIKLSRSQLQAITPAIEAFGDMEGFPTHARGASIRFDET
jgi:histidinol dehydrogenase